MDDLLDLLGRYRNLRLVLIGLAHAQASNQLKLVPDEVRVVDDRGARLFSHLDELGKDVVTLRTMSRKLIIRVSLENIRTSPQ